MFSMRRLGSPSLTVLNLLVVALSVSTVLSSLASSASGKFAISLSRFHFLLATPLLNVKEILAENPYLC